MLRQPVVGLRLRDETGVQAHRVTEGEPGLALIIAREARRTGVLSGLWQLRSKLTMARLDNLLLGDYGEDLSSITLDELIGPMPKRSAPVRGLDSIEDAVMAVFRARPGVHLSSGFFTRHLGLERWTAQKLLADLAERGLLEREGKTSGTRYCLAGRSRARARLGTTG
jgi:hypothetical protein